MLFAQIAAFILVLVVFTAYGPGQPGLAPTVSFLASGMILAALWVGCRLASVLFLGRMNTERAPADPARAAHRLQFYFNLAGVAAFVLLINQAEVKAQLMSLSPLFKASELAAGSAAIALYLLCLAAVWWAGFPLEKAALNNDLPISLHVSGQLRFVAPVVFPWLLMSTLRDLLAWLSPSLAAWLDTSLGDLLFLLVFMGILSLVFPFAVKSWWGCRPLALGRARRIAQDTLALAGVRVAGLLSWPILQGRLLTAGILGVVPAARFLLVTPGLVAALDDEALEAVVAHEAGHVRYRHIISYLSLFAGFFFLAYALVLPPPFPGQGRAAGRPAAPWLALR